MNELSRIRSEYRRRYSTPEYVSLYSVLNVGHLHMVQSREQALIALLRRQSFSNFSDIRFLDVGCGSGTEILRWIGYGVLPENCVGIDLMQEHIVAAQQRLPTSTRILQGDASQLPFGAAEFDIVTQYTVLSSILDDNLRRRVAAEMLRVLKYDGIIISYDFWLNPTNRQTKGIHLAEIKSLFPDCTIDARRVTLAPPIARRIAPHSYILASLLEKLPLKTHWLISIRKKLKR